MTSDADTWLAVRRHLRENRTRLSERALESYPGLPTVAGTPLLTRPGWVPSARVPLDDVTLVREPDRAPAVTGEGYAATMAALAPPRVFENRPTYRLHAATLEDRPRLAFGLGRYFDSLDVGEACAHELAAVDLGVAGGTPLRDSVGDPTDPSRRGINLAVSTLTLRVAADGSASFPLHWRDPAKVGHAGGTAMVVPTGVFQPVVADDPADFSLWHGMLREFAEELLGAPEPEAAVDYEAWPFATALAAARVQGLVRAEVLGLGVDPLTLATDLLTVVAFDADLYDELFGARVAVNDEGRVDDELWAFTPEVVAGLTDPASDRPMQAAGAATLRLALSTRAGTPAAG